MGLAGHMDWCGKKGSKPQSDNEQEWRTCKTLANLVLDERRCALERPKARDCLWISIRSSRRQLFIPGYLTVPLWCAVPLAWNVPYPKSTC